jgi:hypothetical protein
MFETSVRVRPCSDRASRQSSGRLTWITPSSRLMLISSEKVCESSPFGPLTVTVDPSIFTSTPDGTGMGCLPIRDTAIRSFPSVLVGLPDVGDDFAANAGLTCVAVRHHALRRGDDCDTQAAEKKLAGAAKTSFVNKCVKDAAATK